jgi:hypothetical protein
MPDLYLTITSPSLYFGEIACVALSGFACFTGDNFGGIDGGGSESCLAVPICGAAAHTLPQSRLATMMLRITLVLIIILFSFIND